MADIVPHTVCGVLMDGATPDADGVIWRVFAVDGWDAASVRVTDGDLTGRHGGYGSAPLWAARVLTIAGRANCPDLATAQRVRDRIASDFMSGQVIAHEAVPKVLDVAISSAPRSSPARNLAPYRVGWQLIQRANDPFKRSLTPRTTIVGAGATVAAANDGTAAADLVVTLTSPGTVVLSAGGVTLTTGSLPAGAVIDTGATTVRDSPSGSSLFHLVTMPALWPALPAGGGSIQQAGTAGLSIEHSDPYA